MPVGTTYKQTITIVSMKQEINIKEVHAKIKEEMGQNMIKSQKLFFQFSKFAKINCHENVLEDKNAKINIREQKLIYSIRLVRFGLLSDHLLGKSCPLG